MPDQISLIDEDKVTADELLSSHQVTDTYLAALAAHHGARLATFDAKLVTSAVVSGENSVFHIP